MNLWNEHLREENTHVETSSCKPSKQLDWYTVTLAFPFRWSFSADSYRVEFWDRKGSSQIRMVRVHAEKTYEPEYNRPARLASRCRFNLHRASETIRRAFTCCSFCGDRNEGLYSWALVTSRKGQKQRRLPECQEISKIIVKILTKHIVEKDDFNGH